MEKTCNAVGLIEKVFLWCTSWSPGTSHSFHESTQLFSPYILIKTLVGFSIKKKKKFKSIQELFPCIVREFRFFPVHLQTLYARWKT